MEPLQAGAATLGWMADNFGIPAVYKLCAWLPFRASSGLPAETGGCSRFRAEPVMKIVDLVYFVGVIGTFALSPGRYRSQVRGKV
ncbi:hypothetical protein AB4Y40_18215 [Paraburkholderia sp. EG287B]|uniref:hypothetical protein n=1 Tax=Paraburkholderia sp. EG287B TaxID=3237010 RepID=UPI0034D27534